MSERLLVCAGGTIEVPVKGNVLVPREDGGHLIVNPPRPVWERSELTKDELLAWSMLVASAGQAMIESLPQLRDGCVNYWEAGNWALHALAEPAGEKSPRIHRQVHLHLLGRSRNARHPAWQWGEAPAFPPFVERETWSAALDPLSGVECKNVAARAASILADRYGISAQMLI